MAESKENSRKSSIVDIDDISYNNEVLGEAKDSKVDQKHWSTTENGSLCARTEYSFLKLVANSIFIRMHSSHISENYCSKTRRRS